MRHEAYYGSKSEPTKGELDAFFQGIAYSLQLIEGKADCLTARKEINKGRMTMHLYRSAKHVE